MNLSKLTANLNNISSLPDKPTLQTEELKKAFDEGSNIIKDYINEILTVEIEKQVTELVNSAKIIVENVLTSESTINALSASQGNALKTAIDTINAKLSGIESGANKTIIENVLTSDSTTKALSSAQGKALKTLIDTLTTTVSGKQKTITRGTATPSGGSNGDYYIQYF